MNKTWEITFKNKSQKLTSFLNFNKYNCIGLCLHYSVWVQILTFIFHIRDLKDYQQHLDSLKLANKIQEDEIRELKSRFSNHTNDRCKYQTLKKLL